jgi:hypothetical protein
MDADRADGLLAIKYEQGKLAVLDQLRLPHEFVYDDVSTCEEAWDCIKAMRVRGTFQSCPLKLWCELRLDRSASDCHCRKPCLGRGTLAS